jgi:hypothetical protein
MNIPLNGEDCRLGRSAGSTGRANQDREIYRKKRNVRREMVIAILFFTALILDRSSCFP